MDNKIEQFYTEEPIAEFLNISVKTLRAMRLRGDGPPFYKLGGSVRYRLSDIEQWIEERRRTSTQ